MRWLITGGCGFIGTAVVRDLAAADGHAVRVLDNLSVGTRADLAAASAFEERDTGKLRWPERGDPGTAVELVVGDILNESVVRDAAEGAEVVLHLAASTGVAPSVADPRTDCAVNVAGTLNVLEAARHGGARRLVFASSGAPVGECEPPIHEDCVPHPVSPYGASKLAGEAYCSAYFRTFGLETVALRFGNVYGPGSHHKSSVVARFIRQALDGETLEIYGDGRQTRDFLYIDDLIRAVRCAAEVERIGGEVFQIATSTERTVAELVDFLLPLLRANGVGDVTVRHGEARLGDVRRNYSDTTKARRRLDWQARVSLREGLERTVVWFVSGERGERA